MPPTSLDTLPEGVPVTPILSYPGGLQDEDIVTEVEGVAPIDWFSDALARDLARPEWTAGDSAAYTILRDGQPMDIEQPLIQYPLGEAMVGEWGFWLFVFGNMLVALVAFSRKPDEPALRVYLLTAASIIGFRYLWIRLPTVRLRSWLWSGLHRPECDRLLIRCRPLYFCISSSCSPGHSPGSQSAAGSFPLRIWCRRGPPLFWSRWSPGP